MTPDDVAERVRSASTRKVKYAVVEVEKHNNVWFVWLSSKMPAAQKTVVDHMQTAGFDCRGYGMCHVTQRWFVVVR